MCQMDKSIALVMVTFCCCASALLTISDLKVPEEIEHGSNKNEVVLDCDFRVDDANDKQGLEIKWFYANGTQQIYQWIPRHAKPQAMGILKDRVDLEYQISEDSDTMYRALKIKNITPELSGVYTCKVSSFYSEATATKKMVIYEPAKKFDFVHVEESDTYLCSAYGIYPKPVMNVYALGSNLTKLDDGDDNKENDIESNEDEDVVEEANGLYNVTSSFKYIKSELTEPTEFICDLKIPDTNYHKNLTRFFYPGGEPTTPELEIDTTSSTIAENSASVCLPSLFLMAFLVVL